MSPRSNTAAWFPETRWTMVLTLRENADSKAGRQALDELCSIYWRPLYAHARRHGHEPAAAEDLTQGFLLCVLQRELLSKADRSRGRMRAYLLTLFKNHIRTEWRASAAAKRGDGMRIFSLDQLQETESHLANHKCDTRTPEALYEYECALTTVEAAVNGLARDEHDAGRGHVFEELRPLLECADLPEDSQWQAADRLGITYGAARQCLFRLRKRLRECVRNAVRDTLANPTEAEIDDELRHLKAVLGEGRPTLV